MTRPLSSAPQRGFTLVELLIVVIILAILAAIVVPQFSSTTDDAKLSALDATLANVRSAVDLYYQQHGKYPSAVAAGGGACPAGATASTALINTDQAFLDQLAMYTNVAGQACSISDASFKYGPYLKKASLPKNPFTDNATLAVVNAGNLAMGGGGTTGGWRFDNKTGKFIADDTTDNRDKR